ncbi:uncharacterized protein LOC129908902 [Episyrphus balteatus]|uniref:uncharacterized protein LOC129908902 n=1 Tax=Episyrphus balteatus TaxID=286459 RepID=UPI00248540A8|nr:uncharacterized protein LOC129908902 [Episyrphus balteatus]
MWTNFSQSSAEDETISNVFCTNGIFKIWSDDLVYKRPQVGASVQNRKMFIAIDKTVVLLEDENIAKCSFLSFNSQIDIVTISNSGNLIVCGLSDGEIHGVCINGIPLFNLSINQDDVQKKTTIAGIRQVGNSYYISCTNGSIYKLTNVDESRIETCLNISLKENETVLLNDSIMENVAIERMTNTKSLNEITAVEIIPLTGRDEYLFLSGTKCFLRFQTSQQDTKIIISDNYQGLKNIYNLDSYTIALTNSGHLLEICPFTKLVYQIPFEFDCLIDDLTVMENNENTVELLILTKPDENGARAMKVVEFPSFKCIYQFEMPKDTWLVNQPKCSVNLYYLSGENINAQGLPQEIEMKLVSETQPAERLKKLIYKGHLEEAEEFGKQFELSLQPIYEAKAKKLLLEMSSITEDNMERFEEMFKQLTSLLKLIENKVFFKTIRSYEIPSRRILPLFLDEILIHLDEEMDDDCIREIKEHQLRLKTLALIDPYECNMDWQRFVYHPNIVQLCSSFLKSEILIACLIWRRHSATIIPQIDLPNIRKLMSLIPANVEPFNLVQWLRHFVPTTVHAYPSLMPYIIDWSIQKTRSLQLSKHWPEIGLEFSTKVSEIFDDIHFLHSDVRRQHEKNIEKLRDLVNALQDLAVLKKSYNLVFTLDNYIKDSLDETAFCILQRVQITNLKSLVNDFLYPIYMERGRSPVKAIRKYISFLVASRQNLSSWLNRAVTSIELLHSEDARLESALLVLQAAPVPWPVTVGPLIKLGESTHPLAQKINTEYEIQIIKIMKVKYGWPADGTDYNMKLVFRIVKTDLPEMIDDIRDLTKATPEIQGSANFYCCYELARKGKIDTALKFFNSLGTQQKAECSEKIINIFSEVLEDPNIDEISHSNLFEFFKLMTPQSNTSDQNVLLKIQKCHILRVRFQLNVLTDDLRKQDVRRELLEKGVSNLAQKIKQNKINVTSLWNEICELATALEFEKVFGVLELCKVLNNVHLSCALAYYTLELINCTKQNYEIFIDLAILVISQQIVLCQNKHDRDTAMVTDPLAFPLSYKLLVTALQSGKTFKLEIIELLKWVRIVNISYELEVIQECYGIENDVNDRIFKHFEDIENPKPMDIKPQQNKRNSVSVFDEIVCVQEVRKEKTVRDHSPVVNCVSLALLLIVLEIQPAIYSFSKLKTLTSEKLKVDAARIKGEFLHSIELLVKSKQHNPWYSVAQYLLEYQKNSDKKIIHLDFVSTQLRRVLRHLLSHKEPNFLDLFAMLITDLQPRLQLENLMNDLKSDVQRVNLLILAEMYNTHIEDMVKVKEIRESRIKQFYFTELCKQDSSLKTKPDIDIVSMGQLMKELRNKMLDVRLLERLSKDFGWDYQQVLVSQVIAVLHLQQPNFEIKVDTFGKEELCMKNSVEEIRNLCQPYINEIKNTELLASKLLNFMSEINYYFYEHYLCVIEILNYINELPKEMQLWNCILIFLKHKMISKRRHRPSQMETDWWLKSHSEIGVLPKISKYRLPFMPIVQQPLKDILDNEINIDNCESWFPLIKMHTVLQATATQSEILKMQDYFCMSAVKNSISDYKSNVDSDTWNLQPTNNAFLQSILRLVQHVSNTSKVLLILYFVVSHAPDGADQVEASYECYKYTLKHEQELLNQEKSVETVRKAKRKYPIFKTQHLLHVYGLVEDKLLQLVENPKDLIYSLYHHEMILKPNKPDINKVCKEIAELHDLDIDMMQFNLLQKWLSFATMSSEVTTLEETFYEDINSSISVQEENDGENVMRAHYILKSWETDKAIQFLVGHIFPADGSVNTSKQLQMFECFSQLNDGSSSYNDVLSQQKYIIIKCVHNLKQLGYNFSLDKFADYDKITILKKIWQSHANNQFAMEVIANICLGFKIYIPKIWNGVLRQMVKFNMIRELNSLVDVLSCNSHILHTTGLVQAWDCVLKLPFKKANKTRSFEQEEILMKTLFRIQGCPVVSEINLIEIAEDCIRIDRTHMAAILIVFCCSPKDRDIIKKLITSRMNPNVRKDILELEESGIMPNIINFVLKELNI